ncbi:hypothetical protein RSAG8_06653, partial [Rhizoctonia solani AG-8 WAC10335]
MARSAETSSFKFNHTMIRVKDPQVSLKFYQDVLGMELVSKSEFSDFTLYFLGYDHSDGKATAEEKTNGRFAREGILELTHNHWTSSYWIEVSCFSLPGYHDAHYYPRSCHPI